MTDRLKPVHINTEAKEKTPVGAHKETKGGTFLGTVVVNGGGEPYAGEFILTLYNGLEEAEPIATINRPKTGDAFPYNCTVNQGVMYTLERMGIGKKAISVTVTYDDLPRQKTAQEHIDSLNKRVELQNQRRS